MAAKSTKPEFVITRVLEAPRELVFRAWTDPGHMARWWGPRGFTCTCEIDPRPGGAYRLVMRSEDGIEYPISGVFREIVEPERLVMTMDPTGHPAEWHDLVNPNRGDDANPAGQLITTATFEDVGGKTRLTVRTRFESDAIRDAMLKMGMTEGWSQSLERLEELVAKI
jgi:uncharacterized protein YndB with AHSA1/START domain